MNIEHQCPLSILMQEKGERGGGYPFSGSLLGSWRGMNPGLMKAVRHKHASDMAVRAARNAGTAHEMEVPSALASNPNKIPTMQDRLNNTCRLRPILVPIKIKHSATADLTSTEIYIWYAHTVTLRFRKMIVDFSQMTIWWNIYLGNKYPYTIHAHKRCSVLYVRFFIETDILFHNDYRNHCVCSDSCSAPTQELPQSWSSQSLEYIASWSCRSSCTHPWVPISWVHCQSDFFTQVLQDENT